jgi:outer membrane autotransporter protein
LNAFAEVKYVTPGQDITETDQTYAAVTGSNALRVTSGTYHGTDITLQNEQLNQFTASVRSDGSLFLRDSAIDLQATPFITSAAIQLNNGTVDLQNVDIAVHGVAATGTYTTASGLYIFGGTANTIRANGLRIVGTAVVEPDSMPDFKGITIRGAAEVTVTDFTLTLHNFTNGVDTFTSYANDLRVDQTVILSNGTITMSGTTGSAFTGVLVGGNGNRRVELRNVDVLISGKDGEAIQMSSRGEFIDDKILLIDGGKFISEDGPAIRVGLFGDVSVNNATHTSGANYIITITGSATFSGATAMEFGTTAVTPDGAEYELINHAHITVADGSTLTGATNIYGGSDVSIELTDHSVLTGDLTASGTSVTAINLDNSGTLTGGITANDHATVDITVSGTGSTLLGDIAQNDEAAVTVTISDSAVGTGGFTGGNLITGGDSTWTFNKDSHGNSGENHGTWNIGDYEVIFDNLTHTGTVNISVNSDTGAGGSITVDTADGAGTVHIDTTGNGKADPNKVLPNIVSGDGTEHWQWDPIDWGIDQLIKDGDHFVKKGTSPAGAVLNSSVAIQQAMWFAQQNSLLKRMGYLRFGARASRPPAGGTPALHNLIENLWIRSYGQQLNVSSQVSGKAYEQLIYGVDLGTDHKFTISADSDLYLGVYAGYGRSDLDYRTPGTDGELNSYYGGLYATWLHSSGFYIDATFKAASVNNDLKAPYGNTQLTASYSDVNLGGSIEIGKKFTFSDAWFIEPQFQVNYLHILAEDYQAGPLTISAQDLDALQLRIGSLFGRTINLTNGGALQPYVKISGVETISSGGAIRNGYQHTRANTDGARAEFGGGIIWQLDANNQLHLDYEASFGDKYDKPWGLTAGYRHQF